MAGWELGVIRIFTDPVDLKTWTPLKFERGEGSRSML
jgi:hypothetical protein